jgi:hypothetical protein
LILLFKDQDQKIAAFGSSYRDRDEQENGAKTLGLWQTSPP